MINVYGNMEDNFFYLMMNDILKIDSLACGLELINPIDPKQK